MTNVAFHTTSTKDSGLIHCDLHPLQPNQLSFIALNILNESVQNATFITQNYSCGCMLLKVMAPAFKIIMCRSAVVTAHNVIIVTVGPDFDPYIQASFLALCNCASPHDLTPTVFLKQLVYDGGSNRSSSSSNAVVQCCSRSNAVRPQESFLRELSKDTNNLSPALSLSNCIHVSVSTIPPSTHLLL